jgi:hypothetical protein
MGRVEMAGSKGLRMEQFTREVFETDTPSDINSLAKTFVLSSLIEKKPREFLERSMMLKRSRCIWCAIHL